MSLRQPPKARNVLWAEDGGIFLQQSLEHGGANAFAPYEGYLHVLPRIAAALTAATTPPAAYALTMNLLSCLVVALIAGMVFHCAHQVDDRIYVRLAFASIVVLIGAGPLETTGNFANLHWYLLFLAPWVLTTRAETKSGAVLLFVVGALTATTEILAAIFVPMMLLRWRDRTYWPPRIGLILGFACQFIATITSPRSDNTSEPLSLESIVIGWFVNGAGVIVYGTGSQLGSVIANFGWIALTAAFLPFLAAFVFILWKGVPRHRLMAIAMLSGSVIG